ncbi:MAG TPA: sugar ABC transporter permease, partial [Pyrodictium sp.]|nr:sugar ABC transporter permease [Pyrodictium sp.]
MTRPRLSPALFFLLPALILVIVFYIVPLFLSIYISFTPLENWNLHRYLNEVTTSNYERLLYMVRFDPDVGKVVQTTLIFVAATLAVNVLGGLALALSTFLMEERISLPYRVLW